MAVFHIKTGGTRTTGASTADDWSNANCYPITSLATVWAALSDGDQVIFDNEAEHSVGSQLTLNGLSGTLSVEFVSRVSGSAYTINRTADVKVVVFNGLANTIDVEWQDAKFTSDAALGNDKPIIQTANGIQEFTLTRCDFSGLTISSTSASGNGQLLFFNHSGGTEKVTLADCNFSSITASVASCGVIHVAAALQGYSTGTLDFSNTTLNTNTSASGRAFFHHASTAAGVYGAFSISGYSANGSGSGAFRPFFLQGSSAGDITIGPITGSNISVDCGTAETGGIVFGQGTGTLNGAQIDNLHFDNDANHEGGLLVTFNDLWYCNDAVVRDSSGAFGMVFATSFDGSINAQRCAGYNLTPGAAATGANQIDHGIAFYAGGSGDCTMYSCCAGGNTVTDTAPDYFLLHNIEGARAKRNATVWLQDCTFLSDGTPVLFFNRSEDSGDGKTVTATIKTSLIDGGSGGIDVSDITQTGTDSIVNLTVQNSFVRDIDTSSQLAGTTTETGAKQDPGADRERFLNVFSCSQFRTVVGGARAVSRGRAMGAVPWWSPWEEPQPQIARQSRRSSRDELAKLLGSQGMPRSKK